MSSSVISAARAEAVARDLRKDSCTSTDDVMDLVDHFRREEVVQQGLNPLARLPPLSASTKRKVMKTVAPVVVKIGGVQNSSRYRALFDGRNAILCASTWPAVAEGITNPKLIHSWDECGVMLNAFNEKQKLHCTEEGRKKLSENNLIPAITETQSQRRMLKIGLSKLEMIIELFIICMKCLTL